MREPACPVFIAPRPTAPTTGCTCLAHVRARAPVECADEEDPPDDVPEGGGDEALADKVLEEVLAVDADDQAEDAVVHVRDAMVEADGHEGHGREPNGDDCKTPPQTTPLEPNPPHREVKSPQLKVNWSRRVPNSPNGAHTSSHCERWHSSRCESGETESSLTRQTFLPSRRCTRPHVACLGGAGRGLTLATDVVGGVTEPDRQAHQPVASDPAEEDLAEAVRHLLVRDPHGSGPLRVMVEEPVLIGHEVRHECRSGKVRAPHDGPVPEHAPCTSSWNQSLRRAKDCDERL
eukprot:42917-Prorocentrum_minimum.AAC.1